MTDRATSDVARYYEQNITRFLRFGGSGDAAAIHRQIWAPGVEESQEAFLYLNRLVVREISPALRSGKLHVLDLGCGVGGTSTWIAQHTGAWVTGIANSARQVQIAAQRARGMGLADRCRFLQADYLFLPRLEPAQAAVAIESFAHAQSAARFFESAARQLLPGGRLVICDDFLASAKVLADRQAAKWMETFKRGWHIRSLLTADEAVRLAAQSGLKLVNRIDLTGYIRVHPPLLLAGMLALSAFLPVKSAALENWAGGSALQVCIKQGFTCYLALTWEKG